MKLRNVQPINTVQTADSSLFVIMLVSYTLWAMSILLLLQCQTSGSPVPLPLPVPMDDGGWSHDHIDLNLTLGLPKVQTSKKKGKSHTLYHDADDIHERPQTSRASSHTAQPQMGRSKLISTSRLHGQHPKYHGNQEQYSYQQHQDESSEHFMQQSIQEVAQSRWYESQMFHPSLRQHDGTYIGQNSSHEELDRRIAQEGQERGHESYSSQGLYQNTERGMDPELFRQFQMSFENQTRSQVERHDIEARLQDFDYRRMSAINCGTDPRILPGFAYQSCQVEGDQRLNHSYGSMPPTNKSNLVAEARLAKGRLLTSEQSLMRKSNRKPQELKRAGKLKRYFENMVAEYLARQRGEDQVEYVRPYEYTLRVSTKVPRREEGQSLYQALSTTDQSMYITELIREVRPYIPKTIHGHLERNLNDERIARDLLSRDKVQIKSAIQSIYPIEKQKVRTPSSEIWMSYLDEDERRRMIDLVADDTFEPKDLLLDAFLAHKVHPQTAKNILNAGSRQKRLDIVYALNLVLMSDKTTLPWNKGLSAFQRAALTQRIARTGIAKRWASIMLANPDIPEGFGKVLLRTPPEEFNNFMTLWRSDHRLPIRVVNIGEEHDGDIDPEDADISSRS
jgi:hypothetical protein